ncbi:histone deacetylase complex subunit SAP25 [Ambystoma mexicanum]|uniref:histone deacetylase complex subunit SAP25 n=1 Tax=Ambystoma mexicanum TaxID=8296 RepID=UPI0037E8CFB3
MLAAAVEGPRVAPWGDELLHDSPDDTCWMEGYSDEEEDRGSSGEDPASPARWPRTDDWRSQGTKDACTGGCGFSHQDPEGRHPWTFSSSSEILHSRVTVPGRGRAAIPFCAVSPTFYTAPLKQAHPRGVPDHEYAQQSDKLPPCNLAISLSNRTLSHPSFQSYYTAVALWGSGSWNPNKHSAGQATDRIKNKSVLPIDTCDFFYTDPLMPPGHRVYNCLSSRSQQVFQNFRLATPPPIMSVCESRLLLGAKSARPQADHPASTSVPDQPAVSNPLGRKTCTKWMSLAEHDALNALLELPHQHPKDSIQTDESTPQTKGVSASTSPKDPSRISGIGQRLLKASEAGVWGSSEKRPCSVDALIQIHDLGTTNIELSGTPKHIDMPQTHGGSQKGHVTPNTSYQGKCQETAFTLRQKARGARLQPRGYKNDSRLLPPKYQLQTRRHRTKEVAKSLQTDKSTTTIVKPPGPSAVNASKSTHCTVEENDAVGALLQLQFLVTMKEGPRPLSSSAPLNARSMDPSVGSWDCINDRSRTEIGGQCVDQDEPGTE